MRELIDARVVSPVVESDWVLSSHLDIGIRMLDVSHLVLPGQPQVHPQTLIAASLLSTDLTSAPSGGVHSPSPSGPPTLNTMNPVRMAAAVPADPSGSHSETRSSHGVVARDDVMRGDVGKLSADRSCIS